MPGTFDQLSRPYNLDAMELSVSDSTNVDPTTGATVRTFLAPYTAQIKEIIGYYAAETGTTPSTVISVRRGTTKIASVTVTTADTPVCANANAYVEKCEALNIFLDGTANADNDFAGMKVTLVFQTPVDESAA